MKRFISTLVVALMTTRAVADVGSPSCPLHPYRDIVRDLDRDHHQREIIRSIDRTGAAIVIFSDALGNYTMVAVNPNMTACIITAGTRLRVVVPNL